MPAAIGQGFIRHKIGANRLRFAVALFAALFVTQGLAQPFVADGGFGRPWQVAGIGIVPTVAVAADDARAVVVWADADGVWLAELAAPASADQEGPAAEDPGAVNLAGPGSIRGVTATMAGGEPAVAWLERDLRTGNTAHTLTWRGRDYPLFESIQEIDLALGSGAGRPWVLAAQRFGGQAHLQLYTLDESAELQPPITLHSTTLAVRGAAALSPPDPEAAMPSLVGWLEGETSSGPFGPDAEWSAQALLLDASGAPLGEPLALGMADVIDERQQVVLGPPSAVAGEPAGAEGARAREAGERAREAGARALWLGVDGTLQLTAMTFGGDGVEIAATTDLGESGRPLAIVGEHAYWHVDESITRVELGSSGSPGAVNREPISVAWSPVIVAGAELAVAGSAREPTRTIIGWFGRTQGGASEAYVTDDSRTFTPTITDHIGAVMGWSPWSLWQEAAGQLLTALLVGIIGVMVLAPLLFGLSLLLVRSKAFSDRPVLGGVVLGVLTPVAIAVFIALRFPQSGVAQMGQRGWGVAGMALLLGAVVAYLLNRRADREPQLGVLFTACTLALVAAATWAFVEYDAWAPVVGLG